MRGIELLQVLMRRSSGRLPVEHVAVCSGHVAVRLQLHQAKGATHQGPVTIMFDLLPQERNQPERIRKVFSPVVQQTTVVKVIQRRQ